MSFGFGPYLRLKAGEESRTLCISIEGLDCAGELIGSLRTYADNMNSLYRDLHNLTQQNCNDENLYQPLFDKATEYDQWYRARKRVANSMRTAASRQ